MNAPITSGLVLPGDTNLPDFPVVKGTALLTLQNCADLSVRAAVGRRVLNQQLAFCPQAVRALLDYLDRNLAKDRTRFGIALILQGDQWIRGHHAEARSEVALRLAKILAALERLEDALAIGEAAAICHARSALSSELGTIVPDEIASALSVKVLINSLAPIYQRLDDVASAVGRALKIQKRCFLPIIEQYAHIPYASLIIGLDPLIAVDETLFAKASDAVHKLKGRYSLSAVECGSVLRRVSCWDLVVKKAIGLLVSQNTRLAHKLTYRNIYPEDAYLVAQEALLAAANHYEPERGLTFANLAQGYIKNALVNQEQRHEVSIPARVRSRAAKIKKLMDGQGMSFDAAADDLGIVGRDRLGAATAITLLAPGVRLDQLMDADSESYESKLPSATNIGYDPAIGFAGLCDFIERNAPARHIDAFKAYHGIDCEAPKLLREIAAESGVTTQLIWTRVRGIEKVLAAKLKSEVDSVRELELMEAMENRV